MQSCKNIKKYLPEFIEGELEPALKKGIEEHLTGCADCRKGKDLLARSWGLLGKWPAVEASPDDFRARFWQRVDRLESRRRLIFPRPVYRRLAPVLASLIFVIILGSSIFVKTRIENMNLAKDIELYEDFEVIQDMDLFADLDFLAEYDEYEG